MPRREWAETLAMIGVLLLWWPYIFAPVFPNWFGFAYHPVYRTILFFGTPVVLLAIFALRVARYRQALKEQADVAEQRAQVGSDRRLR